MSGPLAKLSNLRIQKFLKKPGMYGDGGGLWLCVSSGHAASWIFRYQTNGRQREMGLGSVRAVSIADARDLAGQARRVKAFGLDPIAERDRKAADERLEAAKAITFAQCAATYVEAHRAGWRNAKHAAQWSNS